MPDKCGVCERWSEERLQQEIDARPNVAPPLCPTHMHEFLVFLVNLPKEEPRDPPVHNGPQTVQVDKCARCWQPIDPGLCHCGVPLTMHGDLFEAGHVFIPDGCRCNHEED